MKYHLLALSVLCVFIIGCGKSFEAQQLQDVENPICEADCSQDIDVPTPGPDKPEIDAVADLGIFGKHQVIEYDPVNQIIKFSLPLPANPLGVGIEEDIPQIPGGKWAIELRATDWYLAISVPLTALTQILGKRLNIGPSRGLPNGDLLPNIAQGRLPGFSFEIVRRLLSGNLYLGQDTFAFFIPTPGLNPVLKLTFPIRTKTSGKILGHVTLIPEKGTFDGGLFLAFKFPDELIKLIESI